VLTVSSSFWSTAGLSFFQKARNLITIESANTDAAAQLIAQGFEKQFEEIAQRMKKRRLPALPISVKITRSIAHITSWPERAKCR
jgi:septation ring formation regulator EzrA